LSFLVFSRLGLVVLTSSGISGFHIIFAQSDLSLTETAQARLAKPSHRDRRFLVTDAVPGIGFGATCNAGQTAAKWGAPHSTVDLIP
jgi:hypothetical protein